jgi:RNA polymerase-binding transcription factor DksA
MNKIDLVEMRSKIVAELASIEKTAAIAMTTVKESSENIPNFLQDEAGAIKGGIDLENALSVHGHCMAQQIRLKNALKRLDHGKFGKCQSCDCSISPRRLEAMPGATLCIHCQNANERGGLQNWGTA